MITATCFAQEAVIFYDCRFKKPIPHVYTYLNKSNPIGVTDFMGRVVLKMKHPFSVTDTIYTVSSYYENKKISFSKLSDTICLKEKHRIELDELLVTNKTEELKKINFTFDSFLEIAFEVTEIDTLSRFIEFDFKKTANSQFQLSFYISDFGIPTEKIGNSITIDAKKRNIKIELPLEVLRSNEKSIFFALKKVKHGKQKKDDVIVSYTNARNSVWFKAMSNNGKWSDWYLPNPWNSIISIMPKYKILKK